MTRKCVHHANLSTRPAVGGIRFNTDEFNGDTDQMLQLHSDSRQPYNPLPPARALMVIGLELVD